MPRICKLDHHGFLKVTGVDAISFMQGYTTCDLSALSDATALLGAVCTINGRMLSSFIVIKQGQDLILRMDAGLVQKTITFLTKYIVFSKAELEDISEQYVSYGVMNEGNRLTVEHNGGDFVINLGLRQEHWISSGVFPETSISIDAWLDAEIADGVAWVAVATSEMFLPQMFNYHKQGAIDFDKGCYLGQEIVVRMQHRGELKRRLHRLAVDTPVKVGDEVPNGKIVAVSPASALAVLKNTSDDPVIVELNEGVRVTAEPL
jgi:folate-binding protein YgfZ